MGKKGRKVMKTELKMAKNELKSRSVLVIFTVFENGKIRSVARGRNPVIFESIQDSAARLVGMCTVGEATALGKTEDVGEVMRDLCGTEVKRTKALDARGVYHPT